MGNFPMLRNRFTLMSLFCMTPLAMAIDVKDVIVTPSSQCLPDQRYVTQYEADGIKDEVCFDNSAWSIFKLDKNYKLSGSGYGCDSKIINDGEDIGESLCTSMELGDVSSTYYEENSNVFFFTPYPNPLERSIGDVVYSEASNNSLSIWTYSQTPSRVTVSTKDENQLAHFVHLKANSVKQNKYYRLNEGLGAFPNRPAAFRFILNQEDNTHLSNGHYTGGSIPVEVARWHGPGAGNTFAHANQNIGSVSITNNQSPEQHTFDYDKNLLPAETEAIFALRLKDVKSSERFVLNLSGHYILEFNQDKIYILDTYTNDNSLYEYQTDSPNITIGLGVSQGLENNYKNIVIKEDSNGELYDYEAFHSDNITTDNAMLSETIQSPFYELAGKEGIEGNVTISKAMAFYHELPAHERHARCVRPNMTLIEELKAIFSSGSSICNPKPASDIYSANNKSSEDMRLEQELIEVAVDKQKYDDIVGYHLLEGFDLKDQNTVAFVVSSRYCNVPVMVRVENRRHERSPDSNTCLVWSSRMIDLYMFLGLSFMDINTIVQHVIDSSSIPDSFFPEEQYPDGTEEDRSELVQIIHENSEDAANVLQEAAGMVGMAAMASPDFLTNVNGETATSSVEVQHAVSEAALGEYILMEQNFSPLPNVVKILNDNESPEIQEGESYTTKIIIITEENINSEEVITAATEYQKSLTEWIDKINQMMVNASEEDKVQLELGLHIATNSLYHVNAILSGNDDDDAVFNTTLNGVFHNGVLIGIAVGLIEKEEEKDSDGNSVYSYLAASGLVNPNSLLNVSGAYRGAVSYLRSEVLKKLFEENKITKAKADCISKHSAKTVYRLGFRHDEL
ncbi:hypothetical protein AB4259_06300 [Vibrio amylolyticus]|uniref:hypothetical protein n=1 Tax=Vibrio amylolyticus TaxID=2847292 RepID=UPI003550BE15